MHSLRINFLRLFLGCILINGLSIAIRAQERERKLYAGLSTLDSIGHRCIDPHKEYSKRALACREIDSLISWEYALLSDSTVTKAALNYNIYRAHRYAKDIRCYWKHNKKELRKRWLIQVYHKTKRDTIFEEYKRLIGVNIGGDRRPIGTSRPVFWRTKYCYDSCLITLKGCPNMDGEDNFLVYTISHHRCDTLCNVTMPRSTGINLPILSKQFNSNYCTPIYIKIYNEHNFHYAPGAFSAVLIVKPKSPKVLYSIGKTYFRISKRI